LFTKFTTIHPEENMGARTASRIRKKIHPDTALLRKIAMPPKTPAPAARRYAWLSGLLATITAFLASCSSVVLNSPMPADRGAVPPIPQAPQPPTASSITNPPPVVRLRNSNADNARAYRKDAASHLYEMNSQRIYKGKLPPMLYAIGVLEVDIDNRGRINNLKWMRAPKHAPEVIAEIERTVRQAAPYPVPVRLGKVTYTDTWLWDKGGSFQLDTLTEGQL